MSVRSYLLALSRQLNTASAEYQRIVASYHAVAERLQSHFGDEVWEVRQFGSSVRGTMLPRRADASSDVDVLVVFRNVSHVQPQALYDRLRGFANKYYPRSQVAQSAPTVVLELNHIKFDLVPAMHAGLARSRIVIPAPRHDFRTWIGTNPDGLTRAVEKAHKSHDRLIRPTIRLLKYWNANSGRVFSSHVLEQQIASFWFLGVDRKPQCYFFRAVKSLSGVDLSRYREDQLERLQLEVAEVEQLDEARHKAAERLLQHLLPPI